MTIFESILIGIAYLLFVSGEYARNIITQGIMTVGFFKAFNSLQIVGLFAGFPFGISWLANQAEFAGHGIAAWMAGIVYAIFFILMTCSVFSSLDRS